MQQGQVIWVVVCLFYQGSWDGDKSKQDLLSCMGKIDDRY